MADTATAEKLPRRVKTQQVKDRILATTRKILKTKGFEYVTVTNICKLSGVSVGSFYHHFDSKDNLLSFYFREAFDVYAREFMDIQSDDFVKNIIDSYGLYNNFMLAQGADFISNFYTHRNKSLYTYGNRAAHSMDVPIVRKNEAILRQAIDSGYIAIDATPEEINSDLAIIEKGCIFDWCLCDNSYSLVESTGSIMQNYLRGIVSETYLKNYPDAFRV